MLRTKSVDRSPALAREVMMKNRPQVMHLSTILRLARHVAAPTLSFLALVDCSVTQAARPLIASMKEAPGAALAHCKEEQLLGIGERPNRPPRPASGPRSCPEERWHFQFH